MIGAKFVGTGLRLPAGSCVKSTSAERLYDVSPPLILTLAVLDVLLPQSALLVCNAGAILNEKRVLEKCTFYMTLPPRLVLSCWMGPIPLVLARFV